MKEIIKLYTKEFNSYEEQLDYLLNVAKPMVIKLQIYEEASKMRDLEKELINKIKK